MNALRTVLTAAWTSCVLLMHTSCSSAPDPAWSPQDSDLVFMSDRDGNPEIYVVREGSAYWQNITNSSASENWPQWSPDGNLIAYQSNQGGNLNIWVMRADGSDKRQLTVHAAHDYLPAWSPDGKQILFASWRTEDGEQEGSVHTYVMNADGSAQRRLIADSPGLSAGACWAPDGKSLVLVRKAGEGSDIFHCDLDGTTSKRLTEDGCLNGSPVFSPDGTQIAFYSDNGKSSDLVVMNIDGTHRRTVLAGGQNWYPRWSRDGLWLVFTAAADDDDQRNLDVFAIPVAEGAVKIRLVGSKAREAEGHWR